MASTPNHPFWIEVLEEMRTLKANPPSWAVGKHLEVMMSTGPGMLTNVVRKTRHIHTIMPQKLICPQSICCDTPATGILKPLEGSSWAGMDTIIGNWVYCNTKTSIFLLVLLVILIVVVVVSLVRYFRNK